MEIRIRDVENFIACTTCRTLTEASGKLGISQPALTESIKRLEADLKAVLFYRSRSGIKLTPCGRDFLPKANAAIYSLNSLTLDPANSKIFGNRTLVIGCHPTVAQYSIPKALKALEKMAPDYSIRIHHDLSRNIQSMVSRGDIDLGLVINPVRIPDLVILNVASDEVGVWESDKATKGTLICNMELFQTQSILRKWREKPEKIINTESLELIAHMVAEGVGFGILPKRAVELSGCKLRQVHGTPVYRDTLTVNHRPEFGRTLAEKLLLQAVRRVFD